MSYKLKDYKFGKLQVDDKEYTNDLAITNSSIKKWIRKESHNVEISDIKDFIENKDIDIIIFGTGKFGLMKIPNATKDYIKNKDLKLIIQKTGSAIKKFNNLEDQKKIGFFHLTC